MKEHSGRGVAGTQQEREFSSNLADIYLEYIFSSVISGIIHATIQELEEKGKKKTFGRLQRERSSIQYTDQGPDIVN
jgi:hypothetical protein